MSRKQNLRRMSCYEVHESLFDVLEEVNRILTDNNIEYYLIFGTLLGCIRDGAPIKWDDDIDICVRAEDWAKMNAVLKAELDYKKFFLLNRETKENYPDWRYITRVGVNGTYRRMDYYKDPDNRSGIFIDIFLLAGVPETELEQKIWEYRMGIIDGIVNLHALKKGTYPKPYLLSSTIYYMTRKRLDLKYWCRRRRLIQTLYSYERHSYVTVPFGPFGVYPLRKCKYKTKDFMHIIQKPFSVYDQYGSIIRSGNFPVPIGYEDVLKMTYGDWHKKPKGRRMPCLSFWEE